MLGQSLWILAMVSLPLTILSMRMKTDVFPPSAYVFFLRFVHFYVFLFATTYIFVFDNQKLDALFLFYCCFLVIHWYVLGDCLLNLWERQHYKKDVPNIYLYTIFGQYTPDVMLIAGIFLIINFIVVIMRQRQLSYRMRILIAVAIIPISIYQLRRQYNLNYTVRHSLFS
jgi:hypothetical protein